MVHNFCPTGNAKATNQAEKHKLQKTEAAVCCGQVWPSWSLAVSVTCVLSVLSLLFVAVCIHLQLCLADSVEGIAADDIPDLLPKGSESKSGEGQCVYWQLGASAVTNEGGTAPVRSSCVFFVTVTLEVPVNQAGMPPVESKKVPSVHLYMNRSFFFSFLFDKLG